MWVVFVLEKKKDNDKLNIIICLWFSVNILYLNSTIIIDGKMADCVKTFIVSFQSNRERRSPLILQIRHWRFVRYFENALLSYTKYETFSSRDIQRLEEFELWSSGAGCNNTCRFRSYGCPGGNMYSEYSARSLSHPFSSMK